MSKTSRRGALFGLRRPWQGAQRIVGKEALFLTLRNAEQWSNICYFPTASRCECILRGAWQAEPKLCLVARCSGHASRAGGKVWERLQGEHVTGLVLCASRVWAL